MIVESFSVGQKYRGTVQVYVGAHGDWRYSVKSKNGQILGSGEGYKRRAVCLNALRALFGSRLTGKGLDYDTPQAEIVIPWRLVVEKRDGTVDWIGQIQ